MEQLFDAQMLFSHKEEIKLDALHVKITSIQLKPIFDIFACHKFHVENLDCQSSQPIRMRIIYESIMMCQKARVDSHLDPTIMDNNVAKHEISGSDLR